LKNILKIGAAKTAKKDCKFIRKDRFAVFFNLKNYFLAFPCGESGFYEQSE